MAVSAPGPTTRSCANDGAAHGTVTTCAADAGLEPHGFVAVAVSEYVPDPTAPLSERAVVATLPANDPVTLTT